MNLLICFDSICDSSNEGQETKRSIDASKLVLSRVENAPLGDTIGVLELALSRTPIAETDADGLLHPL